MARAGTERAECAGTESQEQALWGALLGRAGSVGKAIVCVFRHTVSCRRACSCRAASGWDDEHRQCVLVKITMSQRCVANGPRLHPEVICCESASISALDAEPAIAAELGREHTKHVRLGVRDASGVGQGSFSSRAGVAAWTAAPNCGVRSEPVAVLRARSRVADTITVAVWVSTKENRGPPSGRPLSR